MVGDEIPNLATGVDRTAHPGLQAEKDGPDACCKMIAQVFDSGYMRNLSPAGEQERTRGSEWLDVPEYQRENNSMFVRAKYPAETVEPRGKHTRIEYTDGVPRLLPNERSSWHYQLQGQVDYSQRRDVYDVDWHQTSKEAVQAIKNQGGYAIAYMNAGAWQPGMPDSGKYPSKLVGTVPMEGWPEERWLDIRDTESLRPIIRDKLKVIKGKGFDAVEPDNMDGYANKATRQFSLTAQDQIKFNRMVAEEAHKLGLAVFLKNTDDLTGALAKYFDGAVTERAFQLREAYKYQIFRDQGKPVFSIEYQPMTKQSLAEAAQRGYNTITGQRALSARTTIKN